MRAEEEGVLETGKKEGDEGVCPERHSHGSDCPRTIGVIHLIGFYDILLCAGDDGSNGQEEWTEEETLTLVRDRCFEGARVLGESENQGHGDGGEEHEVENVENGADGDETRELVWLDSDEGTKTTSSHSQGVVCPGVVLDTLAICEVWLVGVLPAWNLGLVVPSRVAIVMLAVLLEVDVLHGGRCVVVVWVCERVVWFSWSLFSIDGIAVGVDGSREVSLLRRVQWRGCLHPCVCASSLAGYSDHILRRNGRFSVHWGLLLWLRRLRLHLHLLLWVRHLRVTELPAVLRRVLH